MELLLVVNVNSGRAAIDLGCMSGNMRMVAREVCLAQASVESSLEVKADFLARANVEISLEVKVDFLVQVSRDSFLEVGEDF